MKKTSYFIVIFLLTSVIVLLYALFFTQQPATANHESLQLTPHTAREQKDILHAQQAEEEKINTGPLVASMPVTKAEARVLGV